MVTESWADISPRRRALIGVAASRPLAYFLRGRRPANRTGADIWSLVHDERRALIADLATLSPQQWQTPSLADGWTVHDVAAHLIDNARTTPLGLVKAMAKAKGDFDQQNANGVAAALGATPAETLARLRSVAQRTSGPPTWLAALESRLVEEIAHGEDIRRPLGIVRDYPGAALLPAIRYQARTKQAMGGAKELAERVTLSATDADLCLGTGPEVRGPALSLLMLLTSRQHARDKLSGPGLLK